MFDELWPGGPKFHQAEYGFKLGTDSVLLAHFTNPARAKRVLDLGCGAGVLTVLTAYKATRAEVFGIEIQPESAEVCRRNMAANGFAPERILEGDLREHRRLFEAGSFDLVISNPPYFTAKSGYTAPDEKRATARDERTCSMDDLCKAAGYLVKWGGAFTVVHRPERLSELLCTLTKYGLEPKRLRLVSHKAASAPNLILVEARRGGKPGLSIEPPLILAKDDGSDTEEIKKIYHRGEFI
ncbi:MAG: tRNA1(Val) (adenine(37)-N6)-methyltransferase [Oscillospiraceae bacterium]|nr:tRNA1(Val) (adenine(37)-N6)-methyltransferase [Oscillospiraceae bacterium]